MSIRQVLGAVGAVVGFWIGGPQGAMWGWQIGNMVGGAIDPVIIKGPQVGDLAQQTSQEGTPRPIVYGLSPPMAGNIIASGKPRKIKKRKRQGKGGPKVETESVLRTYAIGICEGPIGRLVRVWRNGELVYTNQGTDERNLDGTSGLSTIQIALRLLANNSKVSQKARFYTGSYDQLPDPALEEEFGVGNVPAHRGTAYIVVENDDLTDQRGAIPQFMFQVERRIERDLEDVYDVPGDYIWTKPEGVTHATITAIGGGGGGSSGGGGPNTSSVGGGGAGAGFARARFAIDDLGDEELITVGEGAVGGAPVVSQIGGNHGASGFNGGTSSFGASPVLVLAEGGNGGIPYTGSGPSTSAPGNGFVHPSGQDAITEIGGFSNKEAPGPPGSTTRSGAGGGKASSDPNSVGPYGLCANDGVPYNGGNGGIPGRSRMDADAEDGFNGNAYGGGGGAGGSAGENFGSTSHYTSGRGGRGGHGVVAVQYEYEDEHTTLRDVITDICARANLDASKINVSMLTGIVRGFAVTNAYPAVEALRALSQVYLFDPSSYDGKVNFVPRGRNTVFSVTESDMLEDDGEDVQQTRRGDAIAVPRVMNLNYYDAKGGLATDKQTSERSGDRRAIGEMQLQTPVVLSADEAKRAVTINHKVSIEDTRGELKFRLPDKFIGIVPADCGFIEMNGRVERARVLRCDVQQGYQEYTLSRDRQSAYTSNVEGVPSASQSVPANNVAGPTLLELLDIQMLRDTEDGIGLFYYVAVSGASDAWQGATVELSYDGGATYVETQDATIPIVMGSLTTELGDHPVDYPDVTNTCRVSIATPEGELEETDLAGLLNRANLAMIGDEIVQFAGADEVEQGVWELSYFLRGRKDTTPTAHAIGTRFVMLDELLAIPASVTDLGRSLTFRATTYGSSVDTGTVKSMVYTGESQRERRVGYLQARVDGPNAVVTWQGVGRLGAGANVANSARFLGYRVTFTDSASPPDEIVVDTLNQSVTQDISSLTLPVTVVVSQLNALTGEGHTTEVTIE